MQDSAVFNIINRCWNSRRS